jgi:predicted dehydrogenase
MTTDVEKSKAILRAVKETGNHLTVTFVSHPSGILPHMDLPLKYCLISQNYRFNPVHEQVYKQLASGTIGKVISVHFEWMLDTVHGADYFRRWHRLKEKSGGLMVHKSGHHFDLVSRLRAV